MATNKLIGQDYTTPDLVAKVTGRAKYAEDYRADGMLFTKLLLSPMPHCRVRRIDARAALATSGVKAVLTADDLPPARPVHAAGHLGAAGGVGRAQVQGPEPFAGAAADPRQSSPRQQDDVRAAAELHHLVELAAVEPDRIPKGAAFQPDLVPLPGAALHGEEVGFVEPARGGEAKPVGARGGRAPGRAPSLRSPEG